MPSNDGLPPPLSPPTDLSTTHDLSGIGLSTSSTSKQYSNSENGLMRSLCDGVNHLSKAIEACLTEKEAFSDEVSSMAADTADLLTRLQKTLGLLDEAVYKGRMENVKNRVNQERALRRLHDYLEADAEVKEMLERVERKVEELKEAVLKVHKEHYHMDRLFDVEDLVDRVRELSYLARALEKTLKIKEEPSEEQIMMEEAVAAVRVLAKGRKEVEPMGNDLIKRLRSVEIQKKD